MFFEGRGVVHSYRDYLLVEETSRWKHEFLDGEIYAMMSVSPHHAALHATVIGLLSPALGLGRCRAFGSSLRVRVLATGFATYPDLTIVRGALEGDPEDAECVTNPTLIVEVLSPSTAVYDRGQKFSHYKRIPSLRQYVLVSQEAREVEVWTRGADEEWTSVVSREGDVADLASVGAHLDVRALYDAAEPGI